MLKFLNSLLGWSGLVVALCASMPIEHSLAAGDCTKSAGCKSDTGGCATNQPSNACTGSTLNCGCKATASGCHCRDS